MHASPKPVPDPNLAPNLTPAMYPDSQVLKELYDGEVLSEEAILQWADEKAEATEEERAFLSKAAPLIQWLRTAESDEEEEGEGDDEDEDSE